MQKLLPLIVILVLALGGWWWWQNASAPDAPSDLAANETPMDAPDTQAGEAAEIADTTAQQTEATAEQKAAYKATNPDN